MKKLKNFYSIFLIFILFGFLSCKPEATTNSGPIDKTQNDVSYSIVKTETTTDSDPVVKSVINYSSIDAVGKQIILSGYFEYVKDSEIEQIVLSEHGTIQTDSDSPSVAKSNAGIAPSKTKGRVVICPDYIGFGKTVNKIHPYMNQEITAINSIDCELAVLKYFSDQSISVKDSHHTIVVGYSQGGSSALAVHKYIENNLSAKKQKLINLKETYCGGSPADLVATMSVYMDENFSPQYEHLILVLNVLQGMKESYPEILGKHALKDFYNKTIPIDEIAELVNKKDNAPLMAVSSKLPSGIKKSTDIYVADLFNKNSQLYKDLVNCLKKNDLTNWQPKHVLNIYHATNDDVVPYVNFTNLTGANKMGRYPSMISEHSSEVKGDSGKHGAYCSSIFYPAFLSEINN